MKAVLITVSVICAPLLILWLLTSKTKVKDIETTINLDEEIENQRHLDQIEEDKQMWV